ncbi:YybH family protein [Fibrivirga algicola]|uniref:Nuclear transport factor 2 family protein n=1 Tax=Fibrivirga algicola TaxID=2950420 RepID=A0ABX0Q9Q3_9BACT|nr:nuclear transport factor 2 family protein [Fibrivirga algicola]NID08889.1 nuclear transport factor 2 family protein [Fibrivirga algicola]
MKTIIQLFALTLLFASCKKGSEPAQVEALNQQFIQAWNNKETDKVVGLLDDNVQFLQGETRFTGKSEVAEKWVRATLPTISNLKTSTISTAADSKIAYEAGTFSVDVLPEAPGEPRGVGEGNFMLLWKKGEDESWKLSYAQLEGLPVQARQ